MGAGVTILKFFFDVQHELEVYEPDPDGNELLLTEQRTTVENELHKLACNIGFGRKWAGVNYHADVISGLKRGEKVALSCLQDLVHRYPMPIQVTIARFNTKPHTISN
jgi:hypothetical protein